MFNFIWEKIKWCMSVSQNKGYKSHLQLLFFSFLNIFSFIDIVVNILYQLSSVFNKTAQLFTFCIKILKLCND